MNPLKIAAVLLFGFSAFPQGTIVWDSYGPIEQQRGNHIDMDFGARHAVAVPFFPSQSGTLQSIDAALFWLGLAGMNSAELILYRTDPSNGHPGQSLELFSASGTLPHLQSSRLSTPGNLLLRHSTAAQLI